MTHVTRHVAPCASDGPRADSPAEPGEGCMGRTCLQWRADGELAEPDAALVLARLLAVDAAMASLVASGGFGQS